MIGAGFPLFGATCPGYARYMIWIVLLVALVLIFGLGSVLEAAFWILVLLAIAVIVLTLLAASALKG